MTLSFDTRHLRLFGELGREPDLSRAAERLGHNRTSLYNQIRVLEDRLGTHLFRRGNRSAREFTPTAGGLVLLTRAPALCAQLCRLEASVAPVAVAGGSAEPSPRLEVPHLLLLSSLAAEPPTVGQVQRAAARLNLRPSSASDRIERIEALLGVQLFERRRATGGTQMVATRAGRKLMAGATKAVCSLRGLEAEMRAWR